jgi:hypothetical protein
MLDAINNFLNETLVLPPGDWNSENLIGMGQIMQLKKKKRARIEAMEKARFTLVLKKFIFKALFK